jgi:hypothetical protein
MRNPSQVSPVNAANRSAALPRNSENAAPIVSLVDEYSAHLSAKVLRAFTPSELSSSAFHIAVKPSYGYPLLRCDTQLDGMTSSQRGSHR